jgi:hypothetical protein
MSGAHRFANANPPSRSNKVVSCAPNSFDASESTRTLSSTAFSSTVHVLASHSWWTRPEGYEVNCVPSDLRLDDSQRQDLCLRIMRRALEAPRRRAKVVCFEDIIACEK